MRLKEPLYGIRIAQVHQFIHLSMFLQQLVVLHEVTSDPLYYCKRTTIQPEFWDSPDYHRWIKEVPSQYEEPKKDDM